MKIEMCEMLSQFYFQSFKNFEVFIYSAKEKKILIYIQVWFNRITNDKYNKNNDVVCYNIFNIWYS